ncbi:glycosyltransferase family 25 protein, partial [Vibrio harveyi]|uniref:glycosyltransferase family 25 protein n=1 Tax=Vibrio harveyi TaxID=669 RepID=UPI000DFBFE11
MKIYVINLKESVERREQVGKVLDCVNFDFFDAENVKQDPEHFIYALYDPRKTQKYKGHTLTT